MKFLWLSEFLASIKATATQIYEAGTRPSINDIKDSDNKNNWQKQLLETFDWFSPNALCCRILSTSTEALEHIIYACLVYLLVCLGIYKLTFWLSEPAVTTTNGIEKLENKNENKDQRSIWHSLRIKNVRLPKAQFGRVLFVISHPDDECMFFGPLVYSLTQNTNCQVYVLCLSSGNFEEKAHLRREELWHACTKLGVPASNVILVNATHLPDDPNVDWRTDAVANLILNTVESLDIQALLTFDRDGVSQHPNHCAVYYAAASLCLANLLPKECKFYTLDTINVVRKYLSIFDLLCTYLMSTYWCILSWQQASIIRQAMMEHKSQMKWFRWLYIYFSRYMFINSLREVNLSDVELEMQIHEH